MPSKNRLFLLSGLVVLVVVLAIAFAPFAVSNGIRLWISWAAKQEGFIATIDQIDASFLRPVVIRQLHLKSMRENALRVDLTATDASVGLNFKHILLHMGGRIIHSLSIRELRVEVHRTNPNMRGITRRGWATLQRLLPENLSIANSEIRVENGPTLILLRRGILSATIARRNSLGSQSSDTWRTYLEPRSRPAVRHSGLLAFGQTTCGSAVRR